MRSGGVSAVRDERGTRISCDGIPQLLWIGRVNMGHASGMGSQERGYAACINYGVSGA